MEQSKRLSISQYRRKARQKANAGSYETFFKNHRKRMKEFTISETRKSKKQAGNRESVIL